MARARPQTVCTVDTVGRKRNFFPYHKARSFLLRLPYDRLRLNVCSETQDRRMRKMLNIYSLFVGCYA